MRMLFAAVDIGLRIENYSKYVKNHYSEQIIPESLVYYKVSEKQYKTNYTYEYNIQNKFFLYRWLVHLYVFLKSVIKYDIFYFISGETLLPRKLRSVELRIYKLLHKRIIFHFVGSDIRSPKYIDWKTKNINKYLDGEDIKKTEVWQDKLIADAEKYATKIYVSTPDLLSLVRNSEYIPVFIDIEKFNQDFNKVGSVEKEDGVVYILHAPSNKRLKGTAYIKNVLQKLVNNSNYKIKLLLPEEDGEGTYSISRYKLFEYYKKADIVIDQMIIGWYGLQAIEALLASNIVISYVDNDLEKYLFNDCPIVTADVNNLEKNILESIKSIKEKTVNFKAQIKWVSSYYTIEEYNFLDI